MDYVELKAAVEEARQATVRANARFIEDDTNDSMKEAAIAQCCALASLSSSLAVMEQYMKYSSIDVWEEAGQRMRASVLIE